MGNRRKALRRAAAAAASTPGDAMAPVRGAPAAGRSAASAPSGPVAVPTTDVPQPIVIHPQVHGTEEPWSLPPAAPGHAHAAARGGTHGGAHGGAHAGGPHVDAPRVRVARSPRDRRGITVEGQSPAPPELATGQARRAYSLDALRGLFLVAMTVGFTVRSDLFPLWMYHRQMPPPDFAVADVAGIAWRDLTYVAFLFTMAAALPLTVSRRVDRGEPELAIVFGAVKRFLLLLVFALLIGHSNTYFTGYTQVARLIAVGGFVVMAMTFTRPRPDWNAPLWRGIRLAGWALTIAFLALTPLLYGKQFSFERIDDIIAGLAFAALAGTVIWYFTRDNLPARLGILGVVAALYLGARQDGWIQQWWWSSPIPWALAPSRLSLLMIVIPGTIAGDAILRWTRGGGVSGSPSPAWGTGRLALLGLLAAAVAPVFTIGMYNRRLLLTTQVLAAMIVAGMFLVARPRTSLEQMLRSLFVWGATWLLLGLFLEPAEGGIRKVPETLSYFLGVTGVSVMLLVALTVVVDALRKQRWVSALIDVGHNPMLCYVLYTVLLNSAFELIPPLRGMLRASTGEILLRMLLETVLVILIVRFFARRRIYWRT